MSEEREAIIASVRQRFARLARSPEQETAFPVGPESAKQLGYLAQAIDALPPSATESFAGVGNPLAIGELSPGDTVLDVGCGAGMDSILVAQGLAPSGKVFGIDMVPEMLLKAQQNAKTASTSNVQFLSGSADDLPLAEGSVDVIITNGVFNLCLDKLKVVSEMFRVLRSGGRLQMADILLEKHVTPAELASKGTWSD